MREEQGRKVKGAREKIQIYKDKYVRKQKSGILAWLREVQGRKVKGAREKIQIYKDKYVRKQKSGILAWQ